MEARKVEPMNGWLWIKEGWALFKKSPVLWVALTVVMVIGLVAIASIPVVGDPLATLLAPALLAGFMLGCRALQQGEQLELAHLFAGFKERSHQLIALGGLNFAAQLLIAGVVKLTGGGPLLELLKSSAQPDDPMAFAQAISDAGLSIVIGSALYAVLVMAMQFAPALVLFNNAPPLKALKSSLQACLHNILPLSVYGAVMLALGLVATILFMVGWLVLLPVIITATYAAYRDLFPPEQG